MNRSRPFPRSIRRLLSVIALVVILAAVCAIWDGTCALPQDLLFSDEFAPMVYDNINNPGQIARLLYDEVSRQLRWRGSSRLHEFNLHEICENDGCVVEYISIDLEIEHSAICSWADNHYNHSLATVTIDDFTTMHVEFSIETIRVNWGRYEQPSSSIFTELEQVQKRARLSNRFRQVPVRIKYNRYDGNWFPYSEWSARIAATV